MASTAKSAPRHPGRTMLVVAGMHRSGTSAMARVLGLAGARMPDRLINAASDNPLGFWEPRDIVALNDEILRTIGSDWNDAFGVRLDSLAAEHDDFIQRARSILSLNYGDASLAVMKDPRISNLVSLWRKAMRAEGFSPVFVIMVRDPLEVAQSIAARGGGTAQASMLSWLSHMVSVERDTRDLPRTFVSYDALLDNWEAVLASMRRDLSLPLPVSSDQGAEISSFLSRSSRHHATEDATWIERADLWPGIAEAWRWLKTATGPAGPQSPFPQQVADDLAKLSAQFGPVIQAQKDLASRREQDLRSALADREAIVLRLKAQAREYETVAADASLALASMRHDLAQARSDATKASTKARRLARDLEMATTGAEEAGRRYEVTLEQAAEGTTIARNRIAQLEQELTAATSEVADHQQLVQATAADMTRMSERVREALEALGQESARCATLETSLAGSEARTAAIDSIRSSVEAEKNELSAELERCRSELGRCRLELEGVLASPSWSLTRPLRMVGDGYRAVTRGK